MSALSLSHTGKHTQQGQNVPTLLFLGTDSSPLYANTQYKKTKLFQGVPHSYSTPMEKQVGSQQGHLIALKPILERLSKEQGGRRDISTRLVQ